MAFTRYEIIWLRKVLANFHTSHSQSAKLYYDNKGALHIASNPIFHERIIREKLQNDTVHTFHMPTNQQLANLCTKALGSKQFHYLLGKLGIMNIHSNLRKGVKEKNMRQEGKQTRA
jgi:hypothetical protein